jgi:hypothetical protein
MHFEVCCSPADLATGIASPTDEELTMADVQAILDKLAALELRVVDLKNTVDALAADVPDNLIAQLAELRINLRRDLKADGVPDTEIRT